MRRAFALPALALATTLALSACSGKATDASGGGGSGGVQVGPGVTEDTITLGAFTDLTGPFKLLSEGVIAGHEMWRADVNAGGGICGRQIEFNIVDHGYSADTAVVKYPQLAPDIAGFIHLLGSPINAAIDPKITEDELTAVALSWSSFILDTPYVIIPGTTYDLEIINGLSYLMEQGMIADGDTVGHVYIDGEYGENGLLGTQYFAEQHNLDLRPVKITSRDTDMSDIVTSLRGAGATAIALTTTPAQTRSVLNTAQGLRYDVPVVGNNPVFDPTVLDLPAPALDNLFIVSSSTTFASDVPKAQEVAQTFNEQYADAPPNSYVPYGYAIGLIWQQILERACENGDLTRAGIQQAFRESDSITTQNLVADLDFSVPGAPATREVYISTPDTNVPGGQRTVTDLFKAPEAETYVAPHQPTN
ncbi:MAG: ABC transporter substrate-binding protein [Pseudonocardiaceae bacterium]|nr:ABC transporter substrate-binding protein [Pseudonocardiaceae bacterium]